MNKKGLTLVELMAVFVIIGILAIMVTPGILAIKNSVTQSTYESKVNLIENAAFGFDELEYYSFFYMNQELNPYLYMHHEKYVKIFAFSFYFEVIVFFYLSFSWK